VEKWPEMFVKWAFVIFIRFDSEYSFLGASWNLFGASCVLPYLLYYLLSPQEAPKSFQEAPRKLQKNQGRNPYNIFVAILENRCLHKFILSLTDL
jgi:hypothetical protein